MLHVFERRGSDQHVNLTKNWKNTEKYVLKSSRKYQKMKLLMQGHWPTCEPHHLSTGTRQHWLTSHNYSPLWWVFIIIYILYHHYWLGSLIIHNLLNIFHASAIIADLFPIIVHLVDWNFLYHTLWLPICVTKTRLTCFQSVLTILGPLSRLCLIYPRGYLV